MKKAVLTSIVLSVGLLFASCSNGRSGYLSDYSNTIVTGSTVPATEKETATETSTTVTSKSTVPLSSKELLEKYISGDTSVLEETQQELWGLPDLHKRTYYEYTYMDLDDDGDEELIIQTENNPKSFAAIFYAKDNMVFCGCLDAADSIPFSYPIDNGYIVIERHEDGLINHSILKSKFGEGCDFKSVCEFFTNTRIADDPENPYPHYRIDGKEVPKEEYEEKLKTMITDHLLDRDAWTRIEH
ncbi:MAG: hypothetical protein J6X33_01640 [Clostridiales bacterium]|nr:hypothetical protein [Clostridiales bacterium]